MTLSRSHFCAVQDSFTRQFYSTTMEEYRAVYEGLQGDHLSGHCGVLDKRRKAAALFIDGEIPREEFENFVAFCTHKFHQPPTHVARLVKPSKANTVEMIQELLSQFMEKLTDDLKKHDSDLREEQRSRDEGDGYGEFGYDDFLDDEGRDTWGGGETGRDQN